MKEVRLFFRDLTDTNCEGLNFQASGIVIKADEGGYIVQYLHPYNGIILEEYRAKTDVKIFQSLKCDYSEVRTVFFHTINIL